MRRIAKGRSPKLLSDWRQGRNVGCPSMPLDYDAFRRDAAARAAVEDSLFREQGGLCAYTEMRIKLETEPRDVGFHIEHVKAQAICRDEGQGEDVDYQNMVAAYPAPNQKAKCSFGAIAKGDWPSADTQADFVSPLGVNCEDRISFDHRGGLAKSGDLAAHKTIEKLGLENEPLDTFRREAVSATRRQVEESAGSPKRALKIAVKMLRNIEAAEQTLADGGTALLPQFASAQKAYLKWRIKKLRYAVG